MFSFLSYSGHKIMEAFQGSGSFDSDESSPETKKIQLNLQESKPTVSSGRRTSTKVFDDRCSRCLLDSSPVVITNKCIHKFCVKCILYLWSRQKLREPCICPLDGEKMTFLRSPTLPEHEDITSLVDVYNPLFNRDHIPDMAQKQLDFTMTKLFFVDMAFFITGLIAYTLKVRRDGR